MIASTMQQVEEDEYSPDKDHSSAAGTGTLPSADLLQARERELREDVASRLHQLEDMVSVLKTCSFRSILCLISSNLNLSFL